MFLPKRSTILFFSLFYIFSILFPIITFASEQMENLDPDRLEAIIQGQKEKSKLAEKSKKDLEKMVEEDYNMSLQFLAYRGAKVFTESYLKEVSSSFNLQKQTGGMQAEYNLRMAMSVYKNLSKRKTEELSKIVKSLGYEETLNVFFAMILLHKEYNFGSNWWQERAEDGNSTQRILKINNIEGITKENIGIIGLIAAMYNSGTYKRVARGVEKSNYQDSIIALIPYYAKNGQEQMNLSHIEDTNHKILFASNYSIFKKSLLADAVFLQYFGLILYNPKTKDGKTILESIGYHKDYYKKKVGIKLATIVLEEIYDGKLGKSGSIVNEIGTSVKGLPTTAKRLGTALVKSKGLRVAFMKSLRLISRSEIVANVVHHSKSALTGRGLGHMLKHTVKGTIFGVIAEVLIESAIVLVMGQKQEHVEVGDKSLTYKSQRTNGQETEKSFIKDRKFGFLDAMDDYADNKEAKLGGAAGGALAIALMGASFPAVLVAAAVGYVAYIGVKKLMKAEWVQNWKNSKLIEKLKGMMQKMVSIKDKYSDDKLETMAEARARNMMKRKKYAKQSLRRIYLVDELESIQFYEHGSLWYLKNESKDFGDKFDMEAHARYDFIDIHGKRGIYDVVLQKNLVMVGSLEKSSGLDVQIIKSDSTFAFSGNLLKSKQGSNFRVLSNGMVMTRRDDDKEKWMIRALINNTDLAFSDGKGSFHYNVEETAYKKQDESYVVKPREDEKEEKPSIDISETFVVAPDNHATTVSNEECRPPLQCASSAPVAQNENAFSPLDAMSPNFDNTDVFPVVDGQ
ncbi:MAG: hypothetical protein COB02_14030 [Candidatus Cloacimonadota bacterium]|nr:MAG: hypothetical protein COB02_14030 [Candidatus Cloacimonadota bacterium]